MSVLVLGVVLLSASRFVKFEVSSAGLRIRGDVYGRTIPASDLILDQAQALDLRSDRDHQLGLRTNGIGLPGYAGGWFRLKNGEKCLAFVTDRSRTAYVPTRQGYAVLMSVAEPAELISALRRISR